MRSAIAARLPRVPRYRQKVRFVPLALGRPTWVDDPHFNLDYHVRRTALPAPGGQEELRNLVGRVMSQQLDRAKPLWEMWVAEGLDDGRWALISKVHHCMTYRAIGSKGYPSDPDRLRMRAARCFERGIHPGGSARQLAAVVTAPDRTPLLRELRVPTTVIHGSADPLVRPSGGRATAKAIPGARLLILPDMGHDLPPALWPPIIDAISHNASAADS